MVASGPRKKVNMKPARITEKKRPFSPIWRLIALLGSSGLATVVILVGAAVLAWATFFVEGPYGTPFVQFYVYQSWWFTALAVLLGINLIASTLMKWPWRRQQTGFLVVHAGIVVLLVGCWFTKHDGIEATVSIFEGETTTQAIENRQHFDLTLSKNGTDDKKKTVRIPFAPGPLSWNDYAACFWFPWRSVSHDQGLHYENNGVGFEVLDYYADSEQIAVPRVELEVRTGRTPNRRSADAWQRLKLSVRKMAAHRGAPDMRLGDRAAVDNAGWVTFSMATTKAETGVFLQSGPEGDLGLWGQLVLEVDGQKHLVSLVDLLDNKPKTLGNSGKSVELTAFDLPRLRLQLRIFETEPPQEKDQEKKTPATPHTFADGTLLLHALKPNLDQPDRRAGYFGTWWFDPTAMLSLLQNPSKDETSDAKKRWAAAARQIPRQLLDEAAAGRIDLLQSDDEKLFYRFWDGHQVAAQGPVPLNQDEITVAAKSTLPIQFYVAQFSPAKTPGFEVRPIPFSKEAKKKKKTPRTLVRLQVGEESGKNSGDKSSEKSKEAWLTTPGPETPAADTMSVDADGQTASIRLTHNKIDLGFGIRLKRFERRFDPGTKVPSHYGSLVDLVKADDPSKPIEENLTISMNRPLSVNDPKTGRTYRLFQSSYGGPFGPGDAPYDEIVGGTANRDELYISYLSLAYDPGRAWKYAGCYMTIAGIAIMYYMKAYFFRRRRKSEDE